MRNPSEVNVGKESVIHWEVVQWPRTLSGVASLLLQLLIILLWALWRQNRVRRLIPIMCCALCHGGVERSGTLQPDVKLVMYLGIWLYYLFRLTGLAEYLPNLSWNLQYSCQWHNAVWSCSSKQRPTILNASSESRMLKIYSSIVVAF